MLAAMLILITLVACDQDDEPDDEITTSSDQSDSAEESENHSQVEILQLQSEARYAFEQMFLPSVIYDTENDEVIDLISNQDESGMESFLLDAWEDLVEMFINFSVTEGELDAPVERNVLGLGDEHITSVTAEMLDEETPAFIISMLDIEQFLRSTYIAIVYHDNELKIYTLEQSDGFHIFCFVNLHYRGSYFEIENDRDAFIEAIVYVLDGDIDYYR